ncbi:phosphoribosylformylglycinamidine cyclo-ligase [Synergistales bacterium]|nr:phosphoribosylformylglycinamidine cyclo-ligase [Synergistales bacterium]
MTAENKKNMTYRDAGVDVDAGNIVVEEIKEAVRATYRPEVLGDLGGFGGLFAPRFNNFKEPVLVSGTDGVGTKLKIAFMMNRHDTIGQDVVAMCVNDVLAQGAEPLFFLDYLAVGKLIPSQVKDIVSGVAAACRDCGCSLIGGETAEMAGFYKEGEYDVAGFCVGIAERSKLLPRADIEAGDAIIGLPSSGLHSNGFSLARKICFEHMELDVNGYIGELERALGDELLKPTRLYPNAVLPLLPKFNIKGVAHITGGGFYDNLPRVLRGDVELGIDIELGSWPIFPIFGLLQRWGNVEPSEMFRTFNMGIGLALVAPPGEADGIISELRSHCEAAYRIGSVVKGKRAVRIAGIDTE